MTTVIRSEKRRAQLGFALIELSIAVILSTIFAVLATNKFVQDFEEDLAASTGQYYASLNGFLQTYMTSYVLELSNNQNVTSVIGDYIDGDVDGVNPIPNGAAAGQTRSPTFAQLKALNIVPGPFPERTPLRQPVTIRIDQANCPGPTCQLTAVSFTPAAVARSGVDRPDLALIAQRNSNGVGVVSTPLNPARLRGNNCDIANPVAGTPAGVSGSCSNLNAGLYSLFVQRLDARDTQLLANNLSNRGNIRAGQDPAAANPTCGRAELLANGRVVTNTANCVASAMLETVGTNGLVRVFNSAGAERLTLSGDNGSIIAGTPGGARVQITGDTGNLDATGVVSVLNGGNANVRLTNQGLISGGTGGTIRFQADGATGNLDVRNAAGVSRIDLLGSTGVINAKNAGGITQASIAGDNGNIDTRGTVGADGNVTSRALVRTIDGAGVQRTGMTNTGQVSATNAGGVETVLIDGSNSRVNVAGNRVVLDGTNGLAQADRLQAREAVQLNAVCAATEQGEIRQRAGVPGAFLNCQNGAWTVFGGRRAVPAAACGPAAVPPSTAGEMAVDANGQTLVCKQRGAAGNGFWVPVRFLLSDFVFLASTQVVDGDVVPKPTCATLGGTTGTPLVFLIAQNEASPDIAFNRYAVDNGPSWTIRLKQGDNATSLVSGSALAQQYCFYSSQ